jgi:hypothetical protein
VKKDNQRQGMSELLAKQRAGPSITPSEAARQRRSGRHGPAPDSVDTDTQEDRPVAGTQPPEDLAPVEETPAETGHAIRDQPGESAETPALEPDMKARTRVKGTLLAAIGAVAVAVVCWLVAARRRQATALRDSAMKKSDLVAALRHR